MHVKSWIMNMWTYLFCCSPCLICTTYAGYVRFLLIWVTYLKLLEACEGGRYRQVFASHLVLIFYWLSALLEIFMCAPSPDKLQSRIHWLELLWAYIYSSLFRVFLAVSKSHSPVPLSCLIHSPNVTWWFKVVWVLQYLEVGFILFDNLKELGCFQIW